MNKKFKGQLPQPQLNSKLVFNEQVFCKLKAAANGVKEDECSQEEKDKLMTSSCKHESWPTFWPQCIACVAKHNPNRLLVDKKGREYKITNVVSQTSLTEKEIDAFLAKSKEKEEHGHI